jgi:hypothetical protein
MRFVQAILKYRIDPPVPFILTLQIVHNCYKSEIVNHLRGNETLIHNFRVVNNGARCFVQHVRHGPLQLHTFGN